MSIIKSNSAGRGSIYIDLDYLQSHGWIFKCDIDKTRIWKDDRHKLRITYSNWGEVWMIHFHEIRGDYMYRFRVDTLEDLDNAEQFWKDAEIDFEKAEETLTRKYPGAKVLDTFKVVTRKASQEYAKSIDSKILESMMKTNNTISLKSTDIRANKFKVFKFYEYNQK